MKQKENDANTDTTDRQKGSAEKVVSSLLQGDFVEITVQPLTKSPQMQYFTPTRQISSGVAQTAITSSPSKGNRTRLNSQHEELQIMVQDGDKKATEIEMLEIFVEKSRTIGLGQRLLWHMDKFNKQMTLTQMVNANKDLYLNAINLRTKGSKSNMEACSLHNEKREYLYTEQTNSIFYYNDYRVLLLLDFSQSTAAVYPTLATSYILKMQKSIEAVLNNLLFELPNHLRLEKKATKDSVPKQLSKLQGMRRIQTVGRDLNVHQDLMACESDDSIGDTTQNQLQFSAIEELSESGMASGMNSATPILLREQMQKNKDVSNKEQVSSSMFPEFKKKDNQRKHEEQSVFVPKIYLSIVISGLPPDNSLQLIVQNMKLDQLNLKDLMKTINHRLSTIEHTIKKNISKQQEGTDISSQGSLQAHLYNAQYILDLMNQDAKPLLVFFTDSTNSLIKLQQSVATTQSKYAKPNQKGKKPEPSLTKSQLTFGSKQDSGQLDAQIHKLHLNDAQIISIDLQEQNKICNNFGYLSHVNSLKYWTLITQGVNLTYSQLMSIFECTSESSIQDKNLGQGKKKKEKTQLLSLADQMIVEHSSQMFAIQNKQLVIKERIQEPISYEPLLMKSLTSLELRHENSAPHLQFNPLQMLMYGRPCNYRKFRDLEAVRTFLQDDFVDPYQRMRYQTSAYPQSDLNLSELLLNNRFCPLLRSENLAEYEIHDVNFTSIIEFRSKMGFKFLAFEYDYIKDPMSPKFSGETHGEEKPTLKVIKSVQYQYWIDTFNFITCTLTVNPVAASDTQKDQDKKGGQPGAKKPTKHAQSLFSNQSTIQVKYILFAPKETLNTVHKSANAPSKRVDTEDSLYNRLKSLVMSIYLKDHNFCLLDKVIAQLQKTAVLFGQSSQGVKEKYKEKTKFTTKQLAFVQFQDEKQDEIINKSSSDHTNPTEKKKKKDKKTSATFQTPEQAKAFLHENRHVWHQLSKVMGSHRQIYQWNFYFRYQMMTIVTQSNRKVPENASMSEGHANPLLKFVDPNIEELWQLDQKIEAKLFNTISTFTTLALNRSTFVQVFNETTPNNLYARLREHFFRQSARSADMQVNPEPSKQELQFSYCLIRLNWVAANITECHFGFYQVSPKQRMHFLKAFQKHIEQSRHSAERSNQKHGHTSKSNFNRDRSKHDDSKLSFLNMADYYRKESLVEDGIGFQCFQKNVTSLLLRPPRTRIQHQIQKLKHEAAQEQSDETDDDKSGGKSPVTKPLSQFKWTSSQTEVPLDHEESAENSETSLQEGDDSYYLESNQQSKSQSSIQLKKDAPKEKVSLQLEKPRQDIHHQVVIERKPLEFLLFNDSKLQSANSRSELEHLRNRFERFGLKMGRAEIFHYQSWEWVNQNTNINLQFFQHVLKQRIKDGFVMVNRYRETSEYYHLIKVMKAEKDARPTKTKKDGKKLPEPKKIETVYIMMQYLISIEIKQIDQFGQIVKYKSSRQDRQTVSIVRAELYMERESCFFNVNRKIEKSMASILTRKGMSKESTGSFYRDKRDRSSSLKAKRQDDDSGSQQDDLNVKFINSKDFFDLIIDYMSKVDEFLKSNIFAYHQIVKNSMLKQIESNNLVLPGKERKLTTELCYFKNINARTKRQRRQLEHIIREKMNFVYKDWNCYLRLQYPELFDSQVMLDQSPIPLKKNEKGSANVTNQKLIENQFESLKVEQLVENSKQIAVQNLHMPSISKGLSQTEVALMRRTFLKKLSKVFEHFYDFKISSDKYSYHRKADFYCKLVSKQILLLVEVPTSELMAEQIESQGFIEVKYRRFELTMIKMDNLAGAKELQSRLCLGLKKPQSLTLQPVRKASVKLNFEEKEPDAVHNQSNRLINKLKRPTFASQPNLLIGAAHSMINVSAFDQKASKLEISSRGSNEQDMRLQNRLGSDIFGDQQREGSIHLIEEEEKCANQTEIYLNDSEDFEIDQINQDEVYKEYFECFFRYSRSDNQADFETSVAQIVKNFINYIQSSYEKIFAHVVLLCLLQRQHNLTAPVRQRILSNASACSEGQSQKDESEFQMAKRAMGCVAFKIDLNFAFVIYSQLASQSEKVKFISMIENVTDSSFKSIIQRNFSKCLNSDPAYLYKDNEADAIVNNRRPPSSLQPLGPSALSVPDKVSTAECIGANLQETPDAFSDTDDEESGLKRQVGAKKIDINKMYAPCRKLLLEVRAIIRDSQGNILYSEPMSKFSSLFQNAMLFKDKLIPALVEKAKAQELSQLLLSYDRFNLAEKPEIVELPDNNCSVELEAKFYTIAKYIGLIGSSDIDRFSETAHPLLVNHDKQEDLINACNLFGLQKDPQIAPSIYFKQPLFRQLKKSQIIKVIPTIFKHEHHIKTLEGGSDCDFIPPGEHRVFKFNDIQKRTIYGFLRRIYAVVGENILELLTLLKAQERLSMQLSQKYFGYLLHYQRVTHRVEVFDSADTKRFKNLAIEVGYELRKSSTFNVGFIQRDTNTKVDDFEHTVFYLTASKDQQFGLPHKWIQTDVSVPFWAMFNVENNTETGLFMHFLIFLPLSKQEADFNTKTIVNQIDQCVLQLRQKVKKVLLLQDVLAKNQLSSKLKLADPPQQFKQILESLEEERRRKAEEEAKKQKELEEKKRSELEKQMTQVKVQPQSKPTSKIGSKIGQRFANVKKANENLFESTLNQTTTGETNVQSFNSSVISNPYSKTTMNPSILGAPTPLHNSIKLIEFVDTQVYYQNDLDQEFKMAEKQCKLEVFPNAIRLFETSHRLSCHDALIKIAETLQNYTIEDQPNVYVFQKDKIINLMRVSALGAKLTEEEIEEAKQAGVNVQQRETERILMEIHGIEEPSSDQLRFMCQLIQRTLTEETMKNISSAVFQNNKKMSREDINYIKESEKQFLLLYPICRQLYDKLALLKYFKQSVTRRFLMDIELETKKIRAKRTDGNDLIAVDAEEQQRIKSAKSFAMSAGKESVAHWNPLDNQLLFNFKNSFKEDQKDQNTPLGSFLGDSLALINYSTLDDKFDFNSFCDLMRNKPEFNTIIEHLEQHQETVFKVEPSAFDLKLHEITKEPLHSSFSYFHDANPAPGTVDRFSIPLVFLTQSEQQEFGKHKNQPKSVNFRQVDDDKFGIDRRVSTGHTEDIYWLQMQISVQGQMMHDLFVKNLTLALNQSIYDCLIEVYIDRHFIASRPQPIDLSIVPQSEFTLKLHEVRNDEKPVERQGLGQLINSSLAAHSPVTERFESELKGQISEINQNFSFAVLKRLHKFLRDEITSEIYGKLLQQYDSSTSSRIVNSMVSLVQVIVQIDQTTQKPVKVIAFKYPVEMDFATKKYYQEFQKFVQPALTTLKGIEVHFCTIFGSFNLPPVLASIAPFLPFDCQSIDFEGFEMTADSANPQFYLQYPKSPHLDSPNPRRISHNSPDTGNMPGLLPHNHSGACASPQRSFTARQSASPSISQIADISLQGRQTLLTEVQQVLSKLKRFNQIEYRNQVHAPNIEKYQHVSASMAEDGYNLDRILYSRNFLLVLNFGKRTPKPAAQLPKYASGQDQLRLSQEQKSAFAFAKEKHQLVMDCFNLCHEKFEELTQIMQHQILWVANRQEYLQRIISQKMGTLYSLPSFYEAPKIIKTAGNLKQVYNAQSIYFIKQMSTAVAEPENVKPKKENKNEAKASTTLDKAKDSINLQKTRSTITQQPLTKKQQERLNRKERREERRKQRELRKMAELQVSSMPSITHEFDSRVVFKRYFEDLFKNEPRLKTLNFIKEQGAVEARPQMMQQRPGMRTTLQASSFLTEHSNLARQRDNSPHLQNASFLSRGAPPSTVNRSFASARPPILEVKRITQVKFKDLICNKTTTNERTDDPKIAIADIFMIAPLTQPTIFNELQSLIQKQVLTRDTGNKKQSRSNLTENESTNAPSILESVKKEAHNSQIIVINNTTLLKNPLLFHGSAARENLRCLFAQIENVRKLSLINKQANDNIEGDLQLKRTPHDKQLKDIFERMAIGMKKNNVDLNATPLGLLLEKSRLVYSGVTIRLFNRITFAQNKPKLGMRADTILEDDEFSISKKSSDDSVVNNIFKRDEKMEQENCDPISLQIIAQYFEKFTEEQFRKDFQIKKLSSPTPQQLRILKELTCGHKPNRNSYKSIRLVRRSGLNKSTSTSLLQTDVLRNTINEQKKNPLALSNRAMNSSLLANKDDSSLRRSEKPDNLDRSKEVRMMNTSAFADLVGQAAPNNQRQDLNNRMTQLTSNQSLNIFGYQNVDPVASKLDSQQSFVFDGSKYPKGDSLDNYVKFGIRSCNNNQIVLYVIQIVRRQLHFSCYIYEDIFSAIPHEIQTLLQADCSNTLGTDFWPQLSLLKVKEVHELCKSCNSSQSVIQLQNIVQDKLVKVRLMAENQLALTSAFKTLSFCYDFHLSAILRQVLQSTFVTLSSSQLNLSQTLHYFVSNFQYYPSHSMNFVKEIKLRFSIGQIKPLHLLRFFSKHVESYGYTIAHLKPQKQRVFAEKVSMNPYSLDANGDDDLAFYFKNKAHEQTHLPFALQRKSLLKQKKQFSLNQNQGQNNLEEQLNHYHRLFIVEKMDPNLHGQMKVLNPFEKEKKVKDYKPQTSAIIKPAKRERFGFLSQSSQLSLSSSLLPHYELNKFEKQVLLSYKKPLQVPFEHFRNMTCNISDNQTQPTLAEQQQENTIELVLYVVYVKDSALKITQLGEEQARQLQQRIDKDISQFSEALQFNLEECIEDFEREMVWSTFHMQAQRETEIHKDIIKKLLQLSWKINLSDVNDRLKTLLSQKRYDADRLIREFEMALKGQTYQYQESQISRYTAQKRMIICQSLTRNQEPQFVLDMSADTANCTVKIELIRRQNNKGTKADKSDKSERQDRSGKQPQAPKFVFSQEEKRLVDQVAALLANYLWLKACV